MKFIKNFFKTKYRILHRNECFIVQEHEWYDLIYGWWWSINVCNSMQAAVDCLEEEKNRRKKGIVLYQE